MSKKQLFLVLVDTSKEMTLALKFACFRAKAIGGSVALSYIIEESKGGENWLIISDLARQQARADAEKILKIYSDKVHKYINHFPSLFIKEGKVVEEFVKLIEEEKSISIVVLGASAKEANPGPVISHIMSQGIGNFRVPITIVPENIKDSDLEALS